VCKNTHTQSKKQQLTISKARILSRTLPSPSSLPYDPAESRLSERCGRGGWVRGASPPSEEALVLEGTGGGRRLEAEEGAEEDKAV
jgi:hypothetical protein